jgi:hypothetical protein
MRKLTVILAVLFAGILFAQKPDESKIKDAYVSCTFERDSLRVLFVGYTQNVNNFLEDLKKLNPTPQLDSLLVSRKLIPEIRTDKKAK